MTAPKPLNGNTRLHVATLAEEALKGLKRERGDLLTRLRKISRDVADLELIVAAAGVETVDADTESEAA